MSKNNVTIHKQPGTSTLVRPKFGPGMLLQHEDLGALNEYTRELSRLMFRSFFGYGVICGLVVNAEVDDCNKVSVTVSAGLALGCSGDPVYVPQDQRFVLDDNCYPDLPGKLWVVLCGRTKNCAPRTSMCTSDDDESTSVCTRERDMFEIRVLSERPKCACGCVEPDTTPPVAVQADPKAVISEDDCRCADPTLPCYAENYAGKCGCTCGDGSNCDCEYILLARLDKAEEKWTPDMRVRRFIRPVLMQDPEITEASPYQTQLRVEATRQLQEELRKASEQNQVMEKQMADSLQKTESLSFELESAKTRMGELEQKYVESFAEIERLQKLIAQPPEVKKQRKVQAKTSTDV